MDSLPTLHARVAALSRFRSPDDPELLACRRQLEDVMGKVAAVREQISTMPPESWHLVPDPGRGRIGPDDARAALDRVVDLATQWTQVPSKCHVGLAVLKTVRNGAPASV